MLNENYFYAKTERNLHSVKISVAEISPNPHVLRSLKNIIKIFKSWPVCPSLSDQNISRMGDENELNIETSVSNGTQYTGKYQKWLRNAFRHFGGFSRKWP